MPSPALAGLQAELEARRGYGQKPTNRPPEKLKLEWPPPSPPRAKPFPFPSLPIEIQDMIWAEVLQKPACHTFRIVKPRNLGANQPWAVDLRKIPMPHDPSAYRRWKSLLWNKNYKVPGEISSKVRQKAIKSKVNQPELGEIVREERIVKNESITYADKLPLLRTRHGKSIWEASMLKDQKFPSVDKSRLAESKLANASFQAVFRRAMIQFQKVELKVSDGYREAAAIDVATDLVIIEFERGETAPPLGWYEHSTTRMLIDTIRQRMAHFKRVAVHYKVEHVGTAACGPFQCVCPAPAPLQCHKYKACPQEQACFLDCFPNLEEFYYVVDTKLAKDENKAGKAGKWAAEYNTFARQNRFRLKTSAQPESASYELGHFYDATREFIQVCPKPFLKFLPRGLRKSPFGRAGGARECLVKVSDIYKGRSGDEVFKNPLEQRVKVKFGLLLRYPAEKATCLPGGQDGSPDSD